MIAVQQQQQPCQSAQCLACVPACGSACSTAVHTARQLHSSVHRTLHQASAPYQTAPAHPHPCSLPAGQRPSRGTERAQRAPPAAQQVLQRPRRGRPLARQGRRGQGPLPLPRAAAAPAHQREPRRRRVPRQVPPRAAGRDSGAGSGFRLARAARSGADGHRGRVVGCWRRRCRQAARSPRPRPAPRVRDSHQARPPSA